MPALTKELLKLSVLRVRAFLISHRLLIGAVAFWLAIGACTAHFRGLCWALGVVVVASAFGIAALVLLLRESSRKLTDYRNRGTRIAFMHLVATWGIALAYAAVMFASYQGGGHEMSAAHVGSAGKDLMLMASAVGGLLALFRSSGTSSSIQVVLHHLESLQQRFQQSTDLFGLALRSQEQTAVDAVIVTVGEMLQIAAELPETPGEVDSLSLWLRDDPQKVWRILTGFNIPEETTAEFTQPIIEKETPGAGIVANMAATGRRVFLSARGIANDSWYAENQRSKPPGSMAAILLYDRERKAVGALCLTSAAVGAIPADDPVARSKFERILNLWAAAFTLPIERHFDLQGLQ